MNFITKLDTRLLQKIRKKTVRKEITPAMIAVTKSANLGIIWLSIGAGMLLSKKYRKEGFVFSAAVVGISLFNNLFLKYLTKRPRPCDVEDADEALISRPFGYSFPSGHAVTATMAATILSADSPALGMLAIPLATVISFSRLYLNVHYPTDVIGGVLLGYAVGKGVNSFQDYLLE